MPLQRNPLCQDALTPDFDSQILAAIDTLNRVNAVLLHLVERQDADDDRYGSSLILETVLNATTYARRLLQRPEENGSPIND